MDRYRTLLICGMVAAQVVIFVTVFEFYDKIHLFKPCPCRNETNSTTTSLSEAEMQQKPRSYAPSIWFYEHIFEHPPAQLRVLNEEDGAAPIQSKMPPRAREITIVTQTSADRLRAVEQTASSWGGAMCVAVHVRTLSEIQTVYAKLQALHARIEAQQRCRLQIHVAMEESFSTEREAMEALYPVNAMRNVAIRMATTDLIFILDADFIPSPGLHESLTEDTAVYQDVLKRTEVDRELLVVPAFEPVDSNSTQNNSHSVVKSSNEMPLTKDELKKGWRNGTIDCFHCARSPKAHMPSDYEKYFDPGTITPYQVRYRECYEPYFICSADSIPLFDERFRGYGKNKQTHSYACAANGMRFTVLPDAFVYAKPHPASEAWKAFCGKNKDPVHKMRVIGLYRRFKTEIEELRRKRQSLSS